MAKCEYHGKIEHTEKTVELLYETQYFTFEKPRVIIRVLEGAALILCAFFLNVPLWAKAIFLLIGTWLLASRAFRGQMRADQALQNRKALLPTMEYDFYEDNMKISGEGSMSLPYKKLIRLVKDADYLYLFSGKTAVCMVERASVTPEGKCDDLMKHLEGKTGLVFKQERSLLAMNLYDVIDMIKEGKKEDHPTRLKDPHDGRRM